MRGSDRHCSYSLFSLERLPEFWILHRVRLFLPIPHFFALLTAAHIVGRKWISRAQEGCAAATKTDATVGCLRAASRGLCRTAVASRSFHPPCGSVDSQRSISRVLLVKMGTEPCGNRFLAQATRVLATMLRPSQPSGDMWRSLHVPEEVNAKTRVMLTYIEERSGGNAGHAPHGLIIIAGLKLPRFLLVQRMPPHVSKVQDFHATVL